VISIGILTSHSGTTAQAVIDACRDGRISGRISVVISNNSDAEVLRRAEAAGLPRRHLSRHTHQEPRLLDEAIRDELAARGTGVVLLAGYMRKIGPQTLAAYDHRVINVHPALLPGHGGQGMYGRAVHEAVIKAGDKVSGATVHLVTENYDEGPVLARREVTVDPGDDAASLEAKVRIAERALLVDTLAALSRGEISLPSAGRRSG
jgi:phosphoribosylglycinamide formyltransferase-1